MLLYGKKRNKKCKVQLTTSALTSVVVLPVEGKEGQSQLHALHSLTVKVRVVLLVAVLVTGAQLQIGRQRGDHVADERAVHGGAHQTRLELLLSTGDCFGNELGVVDARIEGLLAHQRTAVEDEGAQVGTLADQVGRLAVADQLVAAKQQVLERGAQLGQVLQTVLADKVIVHRLKVLQPGTVPGETGQRLAVGQLVAVAQVERQLGQLGAGGGDGGQRLVRQPAHVTQAENVQSGELADGGEAGLRQLVVASVVIVGELLEADV